MAASSFLVLLVLSFLLTAAQSSIEHDQLAKHGLPRGIFGSTSFSGSFNPSTGLLKLTLLQPSCALNFESDVSQLVYADPISAILTPGKIEFNSLVVMKVGPTALDLRPVKNIVSPFHPLKLTIEFWSTENDLAATVFQSAFSEPKECRAVGVEINPGATINQDKLVKVFSLKHI